MSEIIRIDPVTRISGFLEIGVEVEDNIIINAEAQGLLYRGFETMLVGRAPLDAIYFTERICGICSAAHSIASALALEDALKIEVSNNDIYLREIIHGFEYIQNHLRHFYLLMMPNYAKITSLPVVNDQPYTDFRLPPEVNAVVEEHYVASIEYSRLAHEAQAVLGGKAPHNHGNFIGGVTVSINAYQLEKIKSILRPILTFVSSSMREDADILAFYYPDYFEKGISYPNFMSYGVFDHQEPEISYVNPGILVDGARYPLQMERFTEQVQYAWFKSTQGAVDVVDLKKADAYTFIKAPRYEGLPMEVGPLARMLISGNYTGGHSCMDRNIARMLETEKILHILSNLVDKIELFPNNQGVYDMPASAQGVGLVDTTRGALGHWISIKEGVIEHYNIITPSAWNLSPKDSSGVPGVVERALIGTAINDIKNPVEIGRIVRSYDPCVSCATHMIDNKGSHIVLPLLV